MNRSTPSRKSGGIPYQIQPEYGDEQADAGRDCRTRLARPNSQARTNADGQGKNIHFLVQLTTCRTGNLTRLIHTLAICVTIQTYSCPFDNVSSLKTKKLDRKELWLKVVLVSRNDLFNTFFLRTHDGDGSSSATLLLDRALLLQGSVSSEV